MNKPHFSALESVCFLCLVFTACEKDQDQFVQERDAVFSTVTFSLGGEVSVETEPLTKSGTPTNDLYGINVYYNSNKDNNITTPYAYGLFDNVEDMSIALLNGYKYKFECTLVKEGKTLLECSNAGVYEAPFEKKLENQFVLGANYLMTGIKYGSVRFKGKSTNTSVPQIDRYYGETTNYQPTTGGSVSIDLIRTVFGAKFIVTGLIDDGSLTASCGGFWSLTTTQNIEEDAHIYSFPNVYECWQNKNNYTWNCDLYADYSSDRGFIYDISNHDVVTMKRNVLTTITFSVNPDMSGGSFSFSEEVMGDDNNIDLGLNSGGEITVY